MDTEKTLFLCLMGLLSLSEAQTCGSQSQWRSGATAGLPKDPRRSWMPEEKDKKVNKIHHKQ